MRPASANFHRIVRGSHRMAARARVCTTFQTGTNPTGTVVDIISGDVHLDANADVRSTLTLETPANGWQGRPGELLTPYGHELFVERGVVTAGGAVEWVSLGYFKLYAVDQDDANDGPLTVEARDRMAAIIDARLTAPVAYPATTTYSVVFAALVGEVYPGATIEFDDSLGSTALGRAVVAEEDRYAFLADLVRSRGKVAYWDYRGVLVVRDAPDPGSPVLDVTAGAGGILISSSRSIDRDQVYNAVVATGEAADTTAPARAVRVDGNPASPTYWHGPYGKVPRYYSSPLLTTDAQAGTAAEAILSRSIGLPYNVNFAAVPNPALEPLDPIRVRHTTGTGREVHVIETLSIPLTAAGAMTGTTRESTTLRITGEVL